MKWTYLLINFCSIIIPFIFTFHRRLLFYKNWKQLFKGLLTVGSFFILWDFLYTHLGVWGFNEKYISGIHIFNLPIEEILFFICIPYACVFTYHSFKVLKWSPFSYKTAKIISYVLIAILTAIAIMVPGNLYTALTFLLLSTFLLYLVTVEKPKWLGHFYFSWLILLIPFFIVNGVLTGSGIEEQVVWYNDNENLSFRLGTIPVEDIFYGTLLILGIVYVYEKTAKIPFEPIK